MLGMLWILTYYWGTYHSPVEIFGGLCCEAGLSLISFHQIVPKMIPEFFNQQPQDHVSVTTSCALYSIHTNSLKPQGHVHQCRSRDSYVSMVLGVQVGTVTNYVGEAVKAAKRGRVDFRADKGGIVHAGLGKVLLSSYLNQVNILPCCRQSSPVDILTILFPLWMWLFIFGMHVGRAQVSYLFYVENFEHASRALCSVTYISWDLLASGNFSK